MPRAKTDPNAPVTLKPDVDPLVIIQNGLNNCYNQADGWLSVHTPTDKDWKRYANIAVTVADLMAAITNQRRWYILAEGNRSLVARASNPTPTA